jgi:hypothetical protein
MAGRPVTGENEFHYGMDLAAEEGTEIDAFAAGTVEYTGESPFTDFTVAAASRWDEEFLCSLQQDLVSTVRRLKWGRRLRGRLHGRRHRSASAL